VIILPIIIIPICCCCCWWWLFYFIWLAQAREQAFICFEIFLSRSRRSASIKREQKKFTTTYTIQGPVVNRDFVAIEDYSRPTSKIVEGDGDVNPSSNHVNEPTPPESNVPEDNVRPRTDSPNFLSTSLPILTPHDQSLNTSRTETASTTDSSARLRRLHPRWVLRLSKLRNTNTAPTSDNLTSGAKRPRTYLSTPRRFLAIKPRYAYHTE
jgi:hypothetical protein